MSEFVGSTRDSPIFVSSSSLHGHGVYAGASFRSSQEVYKEYPWHFLQTLPNKQNVLVCGCCSKFLGSVGIQIRYLQKAISRNDIMHGVCSDYSEFEKLSDIFPCVACCGELYCSEICREKHWSQRGHRFLCTGHVSEENALEDPLVQFKMFCVESNEIFLMVADIIAQIICCSENTGEPRANIMLACSQYDSFVRNIWWEAIKAPKGQIPSKFRKTLQGLVSKAWTHLNVVFKLQERGLHEILSEEWVARTIGMFEQNNVGVRVENPIVSYIKRLGYDSEEWSSLYDEIEKICTDEEEYCCDDEDDAVLIDQEGTAADSIGDSHSENDENGMEVDRTDSPRNVVLSLISDRGEDNLFPPLDGTAFYHLTCKINHSCLPNVRVTYSCDAENGLTLHMSALSDISEGNELFQSYVDQNMSAADRSSALADYGFKCRCQKCLDGI